MDVRWGVAVVVGTAPNLVGFEGFDDRSGVLASCCWQCIIANPWLQEKRSMQLQLAMKYLNRHYRCSIVVVLSPKSRNVAALVFDVRNVTEIVLGEVGLVVEAEVGVVVGEKDAQRAIQVTALVLGGVRLVVEAGVGVVGREKDAQGAIQTFLAFVAVPVEHSLPVPKASERSLFGLRLRSSIRKAN
jgi:hypothetical protein